MTQDEIIEMARQAGFSIANGIVTGGVTDVKRFAKLVAENEREACAKVADEYANGLERNYSEIIADEIRARGQA
jgi:hypothetical protein